MAIWSEISERKKGPTPKNLRRHECGVEPGGIHGCERRIFSEYAEDQCDGAECSNAGVLHNLESFFTRPAACRIGYVRQTIFVQSACHPHEETQYDHN